VTFSIQATAEPSFASTMATRVIAHSGIAPPQRFSPGSSRTVSPGPNSSIAPPSAARGPDRRRQGASVRASAHSGRARARLEGDRGRAQPAVAAEWRVDPD